MIYVQDGCLEMSTIGRHKVVRLLRSAVHTLVHIISATINNDKEDLLYNDIIYLDFSNNFYGNFSFPHCDMSENKNF